jgi:hypothetical protein
MKIFVSRNEKIKSKIDALLVGKNLLRYFYQENEKIKCKKGQDGFGLSKRECPNFIYKAVGTWEVEL